MSFSQEPSRRAQSQSQLLTVAKQVARSLFTATNYENPGRSDIEYVSDLYTAYLQRGPDDGGLGWWVGQLGGGRANVCNAFESSSEFATLVATLFGTATSDNERTEHFVNNFYLGAYGRNATSTELQQQRDALNAAAAQGPSQVQAQAESFGRSLFASQVNDGGISNTQFVTNLYEAFLQRGPDAGGLSWWSGQAGVGLGRQNVLNAFATCGPFYELARTLYREAFWLVSDRLGTPRMIVNKSGSLSGVKRHDYLPFGEEIGGPQVGLLGGRTTTQGYTGDSVRQHFTGYETDAETGLNFAQARYQSSVQGRFTSVDPLGASAGVTNPQSFNRYSYVENNPVNATDPTGMMLTSSPMRPNSAIGVVQTDDAEYASGLERKSFSDLQRQNQRAPQTRKKNPALPKIPRVKITPPVIVPPGGGSAPTTPVAVDTFEFGLPPVPRTGPPIPAGITGNVTSDLNVPGAVGADVQYQVIDQYGQPFLPPGPFSDFEAFEEVQVLPGAVPADVGPPKTGTDIVQTNGTFTDGIMLERNDLAPLPINTNVCHVKQSTSKIIPQILGTM